MSGIALMDHGPNSHMSEWLIDWNTRGASGPVTDNFLWQHDRIYVMDNHRLALWCWWQRMAESDYWRYIHIDRHHDALWQTFNPWPLSTTVSHRQNLVDFRDATVKLAEDPNPTELYRWDTITSALWSLHSEQLLEVTMATANEGDEPNIPGVHQINPWAVPPHLAYLAERQDTPECPWIVDIDLDYFSRQTPGGGARRVFSDDYVADLGQALQTGLAAERFGVITIALSPETTGSWDLAEQLLSALLGWLPEFQDFVAGSPTATRRQ